MEKKTYTAPALELIRLDNDISLALQSNSPPAGPNEGIGMWQHTAESPFKNEFLA